MYKTLIQLVLLLTLILIIFFITNKYFYTKDKIDLVDNTTSLKTEKNNLPNKNVDKKTLDNEILNLTYEKFDTNGNKYLIKAKKGILDSEQPNIVYMNVVEASLIYLNNEKLIIYSKEAIFDKKNFKTNFSKNVKLIYQQQTLESDHLEFLLDKNIFKTDFDLKGNSNYAFPLILNKKSFLLRDKLETTMKKNGIEFRRGNAGGGNQLRQPYLKQYVKNCNLKDFPNVEHIHFFGYYMLYFR